MHVRMLVKSLIKMCKICSGNINSDLRPFDDTKSTNGAKIATESMAVA